MNGKQMSICESCKEEVVETREYTDPRGVTKELCSQCIPWCSEFSDFYMSPEEFEAEKGLDPLIFAALVTNKRR